MVQTSWSDIDTYKDIVSKFVSDDSLFNGFRSHSIDYNLILEHVTYAQGLAYRDFLDKEYGNLINLAQVLTLIPDIGSPITYDFGRWGNLSPTYMRYLKMLGDILKLTDIFPFQGVVKKKKIVEIGGGFGGLARLIFEYGLNVDYTIYDLAVVGQLQKKYLSHFGMEVSTICPCDADFIEQDYDLCISTFALNECHNPLGQNYIEKVCKRSKAGYLVGNWVGGNSLRIEEIMQIPGAQLMKYEPTTGFDCQIVWWS